MRKRTLKDLFEEAGAKRTGVSRTKEIKALITIPDWHKIITAAKMDGMKEHPYARKVLISAARQKKRRYSQNAKQTQGEPESSVRAIKEQPLHLWFTQEEYDLIADAAKIDGMTPSAYMRVTVTKAAWRHMVMNKKKAYYAADTDDINDLFPEMQSWHTEPGKKQLTKKD
ncbi:MAG: hypothetical protein M0024_10435 [Nitrospiraceae bacterium]|nr:hypothetical protein [Nitrospiraceae bacterium]